MSSGFPTTPQSSDEPANWETDPQMLVTNIRNEYYTIMHSTGIEPDKTSDFMQDEIKKSITLLVVWAVV